MPAPPGAAPLELWGGHECTVNRVGDRWFDQTARTGHRDRLEDLARFADLGFKALRYPVLWEKISPDRPDLADWTWADERLGEIRRLGMAPIAGLIHHGSGPRYTHLLDSGFAAGLARHARAVAERYPWIEAYTPVNEPLTTARFSALYGHWYPHARDEGAFYSALLNQIDGVRLSMAAIRAVNPNAQLVQTEDLGHTFSTPELANQADFDNERRWLCWDLLAGRVTPEHMFWQRICEHGFADRLKALLDDPCPPDVLGVNHYLSSERFLDHRAERYPPIRRGGNRERMYADVEAVRAVAPGPMGLERLLETAWRRYGIPLAVTECHNGCTREDQLRWLGEAWASAEALRSRGVDMRAVTVWSLLGAYDWDKLLTTATGHYEPGVFDLRSDPPRATALAGLCKRLATGEGEPAPAEAGPGWWSRDVRYQFEPVWPRHPEPVRRRFSSAGEAQRPILIAGATGTLGRAMARACEHRGLAYVLTCRNELDILGPDDARQAIGKFEPWAVVNCTGWVRVDEAEAEPEACRQANATGAAALARAAAEAGLPSLNFSSDLVFDGSKGAAYVESDPPNPLSAYGRSKAEMEQAVLAAGSRSLVVRSAAFFSPFDQYNFAQELARTLARGEWLETAADQTVSPSYTPDLADQALNLLIDGETGIWHLTSGVAVTWTEFGKRIAAGLGFDARRVLGRPSAALGRVAPRPGFSALVSERGQVMEPLDSAIARFTEVIRPQIAERVRAALRPAAPTPRDEPKSFEPRLEL